LSEYTHTLDSLPHDLSRNFADLRELDAVLSSSMTSITTKIHSLTTMIEEGTVPKQERLWLLTEIAEEATRLKLGGEDKIRVACQAADNLKSHTNHLRTLLEHLPSFDSSTLKRNTTYPHVAARSFMPAASLESGRRRRAGYGSLLVSALDPSPVKRKRAPREEDIEGGRSPRKERTAETTTQRPRNGRTKKPERAASPTGSLLSANNNANAQQTTTHGHNSNSPHDQSNNVTNPRRDMFNAPPSSSSSHPSLPLPYGNAVNGIHSYDLSHVVHGPDWCGPPHGQLEGPGMPVARAQSHPGMSLTTPSTLAVPTMPPAALQPTPGGAANSIAEGTPAEGGDAEGEGDDKTYCFCDAISYGEMIACDDVNCEREWFHLACIGLTVPPEGTWYCEACRTKRNAKRSGRGGRKRTGGSRAGRTTNA